MGYGPPPQGYPPPGYQHPGYQQPGYPPQGYGYGYPPQPPPKKGTPTWVWVIVGVLGFFMVVGMAAGTNKKHAEDSSESKSTGRDQVLVDEKPAPAPQAPPKPHPIDVTSTQLFDDYEANEVAADGRYENKMLRVSGTVEGVDKMFGDAIVQLNSSNPFLHVSAYGLSDDTAGRLRKGQKIVLVCRGAGKVMTPTLRECSVE